MIKPPYSLSPSSFAATMTSPVNEAVNGCFSRQPKINSKMDRPALRSFIAHFHIGIGRIYNSRFEISARDNFIRMLLLKFVYFEIQKAQNRQNHLNDPSHLLETLRSRARQSFDFRLGKSVVNT